MPTFVGADGCKAGRWIACILSTDAAPALELFDSVESLSAACSGAERILLDVPIGLIDHRRQCDLDAKRLLGRANSRVFLSPIRAVIDASDYPAANALSRQHTSHGLSKQSWNIIPRIRAVDRFLRTSTHARASIRECHPEICFWSLNAQRPVLEPKKSALGVAARLRILKPYLPDCEALLASALACWPRSTLVADDVVDAMACAVTAAAPSHALRTLPDTPDHDAHGLPMEMVYRVTDSRLDLRP